MPTTIRIKEKSFISNVFTVFVSFRDADGSEEEIEVQLPNLYNDKTDDLLEWYFEQYISMPYDDVRVPDALKAIEDYGKALFENLFNDENLQYRYRTCLQNGGPENITIEIIGDSPGFQAIIWESLRDPRQGYPFAVQGAIFVRKNVRPVNVKASVKESPTINLLIVTARPNEESDVNYRTIQRPLIDLIEQTETPINPYILRPGTYEALIRHLDEREAGYYHIVHFDLHGSLLDYAAYKQLQEALENAQTQFSAYLGSFGLKRLSEEKFKHGKKAFIFFESSAKGVATPVVAEQLADVLENKQIPICILNACQTAKQSGSHETSLGRVLIQKGMQLVLAMRYSVSVSAAKLMMKTLYQQLYEKKSVVEALARSRKELYRQKGREAAYNYAIELEDWLLPVVYQNGNAVLNPRGFTLEEEEQYFINGQIPEEVQQELTYGFFGRDLDILKIEKNIVVRSNILLLQGMGGAGKTALLKYLASWWLRTGFVQKVFYFGYDLKAHTLNDIIYTIARTLYSNAEYSAFTAKLPAVQENNIVKTLKAHRFAVMLDNTESIIGEDLAIPHTLPEEEKKALKRFLSQLKGGQSQVIIGSRSSEEWLKNGTFENNCYVLKGLDSDSASNFAVRILKEIGIPLSSVVKDANFERLMKLLAGYPLALKAVLPNLKQKTPKRILKELEEGISDLDKGNVQQRTESIIKCIEYAHSNLSEGAQKLLLCLSPFQSVVNVTPETIEKYFDELKKFDHFQNYPFDKMDTILQEAEKNGFMQVADSALQVMNLQPVFTFFLKNKLLAKDASFQQTLQIAFINYYRVQSLGFHNLLISKESKFRQFGFYIVMYEYENLYKVLFLSLEREETILDVYRAIDTYLIQNNSQLKRSQLSEMVDKRMNEYSPLKLNNDIIIEHQEVKLRLATTYHILGRPKEAIEIYKQLIHLVDTSPSYFDNPELFKGAMYQSLGVVLRDIQEYKTAIEYYLMAMEIYEQFQDLDKKGDIYRNLGIVLRDQRDYSLSIVCLQKALAIFEQLGDIYKQGEIYQDFGITFLNMKEYDSATESYLKALAIYEQFQDFHKEGTVKHDIGLVFLGKEHFTAAQKYCQEALAIYVHLGDDERQGRIYNDLGVISLAQEDYPMAENYYLKALSTQEKLGNVHLQGVAYQNLGFGAYKQQDLTNAKEYFEKALTAFLKFPEDLYSLEQISMLIRLCDKN